MSTRKPITAYNERTQNKAPTADVSIAVRIKLAIMESVSENPRLIDKKGFAKSSRTLKTSLTAPK
jgi:hypothetical protein